MEKLDDFLSKLMKVYHKTLVNLDILKADLQSTQLKFENGYSRICILKEDLQKKSKEHCDLLDQYTIILKQKDIAT